MVETVSAPTGPSQVVIDWLAGHRIPYEVHEHRQSYTARETARAEGVDARTFAKAVGVATQDGRPALVVLDAVDHLDMRKLREVLEAPHVRLLTENELEALAPEFETGAIAAIGSLCGLPTYADHALRDDAAISFNGGNHRFTVRVDRQAWERTASVIYADLATELDWRPAWARS